MRAIAHLFFKAITPALFISCVGLYAEELQLPIAEDSSIQAVEQVSVRKEISKEDLLKLSQAFGNFIGKNINNPGMCFDLESLIIGIREGASGSPSPMTEEEYEEMLALVQQTSYEKLSQENLNNANEFLTKNAHEANVIEIEANRLQYQILEVGKGDLVQDHSTPQIHYTGRFIDGSVFGSSEGMEAPIPIPLDQTIPGFSKGLVGMKEGEHRRIYVHPDLAYGTAGQLPPNALLIFDVEIVKADSENSLVEEMTDCAADGLESHAIAEIPLSEVIDPSIQEASQASVDGIMPDVINDSIPLENPLTTEGSISEHTPEGSQT